MSDPALFDQRRLLPHGTFSSGSGLRAFCWAFVATLALFVAVVSMSLAVGVVVTSGPTLIGVNEATALSQAFGDVTPNAIVALANESNPETRAELFSAGVIPLLIREDEIGPGWLIGLTRIAPAVLTTSSTAIPLLALVAVLCLIAQHFLEIAASHNADNVARLATNDIRRALHRQALRLNLGDLDGKGRRQATALFTGQADTIGASISSLVFHLVRDPLRLAVAVAVLFAVDWRLTILTALPLAAAWFFNESERVRGKAAQNLAESLAQRALRLLSEGLAKSRLIRGYGMEDREHEKFDSQLQRYTRELDVGADSWRRRQRASWAVAMLVAGLVAYLIAMKVAFDPTITAADGMLFAVSLLIIGVTLVRASHVPANWAQGRLINQQMSRFLDRIPDVSQAVGAKFLEPVEKAITFEAVTVHRRGVPVFEDLELRLPAMSKTAFVSLDPTEARAAAFLLPRFIEPERGRILFDGEDIAWGTLESLRAECTYVGGREPFFTGTVSENIAAGDKFTDTEILEAAKQCHIHKTISDLADGYETVIGEHGQSLPPGHAFLLGLARAIIRDPAVLIIEEPDCRMDEDLKALVDDAYNRVLGGRTVIFLPRRLSTIRKTDNVVMLSEGHVVAMGPQNELVKKNELYRHWEYITFSPLGKQVQQNSSVEQAIAEFGHDGM